MVYPRFQRSQDFKFARRTTADVAPASTTWASVDTALDVTLIAQTGDVIKADLNAAWSNEALDAYLDVVTNVSGTNTNRFSDGGAYASGSGTGMPGWIGFNGAFSHATGSAYYAVQSGDIVSGAVTIRLIVRCASASTKTLRASTTNPLMFAVQNIGPVDPN